MHCHSGYRSIVAASMLAARGRTAISVDDDFGHAAGDAVLMGVAARLRDSSRTGDVVARLAGDEFPMLVTLEPPGPGSTPSGPVVYFYPPRRTGLYVVIGVLFALLFAAGAVAAYYIGRSAGS